MIITFDIEADGLIKGATKVWCISIKEDNFDPKLFVGEEIKDALQLLKDHVVIGNTLVGHNISGYDIPLLNKLFKFDISEAHYIDTMILSQMLEPEEFHHSLEAWGEYLGDEKQQHEVWSEYSDAMGERCKSDTNITKKVYDSLLPRIKLLNPEGIELEQSFNMIMTNQEIVGWQFNTNKAIEALGVLDKEIVELTDKILKVAPKRIIPNPSVKRCTTARGDRPANLSKWYSSLNNPGFDITDVCGDYCQVDIEDMNLGSMPQVKTYLLSLGWRPTEFNYKKDGKRLVKDENGKPIVTSPQLSNMDSLEGGVGKDISRRILLKHRHSQIKGWISRVRGDERLEALGVSCGCNTLRVRHRNIVNVPKAKDDVFLGKIMRSLFTAKPGYILIGADLDQLEARVAGHFTWEYDGGDYARLLMEGDIHESTQQLFSCSRDTAKTAGYALQFGCQPGKLKSILGCSQPRAEELWNKWWEMRESLNLLKEDIFKSIESRGYDRKRSLDDLAYVKSIDKSAVFIRSWHSAPNALIQSSGSKLFKDIVVQVFKGLTKDNLDANIVGNFHDEVIVECLPSLENKITFMLQEACNCVNIKYNLRVPLSLNIRSGLTWAEIH